MKLRCPDLDHVSGQALEASKMLSRRGVWHEFILRCVGDFFLAGKIANLINVTSVKMTKCQS